MHILLPEYRSGALMLRGRCQAVHTLISLGTHVISGAIVPGQEATASLYLE
jgi:hypothetical protein